MAEARPNVHRRRLGSALKSLRVGAGLTMEEAAALLGLSGKPPLSKIENGKQRVSGLGLTAFLQVYDVNDAEARQRIKDLAALAASSRRTNLLDAYREAVQTHGFEEYLNLEGLASKTELYLHLVPGLLQTKDYATSIVEKSQVWHSKREVDRFVQLRMARQAVLDGDSPLHVSCILDEAALRRVVGGAEVMKAQLEHLLAVSEDKEHVTVRVLPFDEGAHAGIDGSFQLLHFPAGPPVALIEAKTTALYLEEDGDVGSYESTFESLRGVALDADGSRTLIRKLIKDYRA